MNRELFGDESHYYADPYAPQRKPGEVWDSPLEKQLRQLLTSKQSDARKRVEHACRQANMAIREYLRAETALKLSQADRRQSVPYQVIDGIPRSLAVKFQNLPDPVLLLLLQKRQVLQNGKVALEFLVSQYPAIKKFLDQEKDDQDALKSTQVLFNDILENIDLFKLPDVIREIREDVFGAYFFNVPVIQIYWMPIGLFAAILDVSIEDFSFVVLAHELAHAYTHVGLDIDGVQWETKEFARADKMIVEGLAQFYTECICNKYATRQPGILKAFNKLLEKQSEPYTDFRNWGKQHASEIVRFSMIAARSNNIREYQNFKNEMKDIEKKVLARDSSLRREDD